MHCEDIIKPNLPLKNMQGEGPNSNLSRGPDLASDGPAYYKNSYKGAGMSGTLRVNTSKKIQSTSQNKMDLQLKFQLILE